LDSRVFHAVAFVAVLSLSLRAADSTLIGKVMDENNAPVAGAVVSIRPAGEPLLSMQNRQAIADPTGAFRMQLSGAGPYLVTVTHVDFFTLRDRPVELHERANELLLTLNHVRNTSESVNVSTSTSPLDVEQTNSERRLTGNQIFEVPYPSTHDFRNALALSPGVVKGPGGDLHFDGGAENQVQYTLNGFNVSDPLTGTFRTHLAPEAVRSVEFMGGRVSPEYGKGSSGVLVIHTESGDDAWRYAATNFIPGLDTSGGLRIGAYTPRLTVSGPIRRGRAWFSDSINGIYNQAVIPDLPNGQNTRTTYGGGNLLHAQFNLTPGNIVFSDLLMNVSTTPNAGLGALDPLSTTVDQRSRTWFFSAKDQIYLTRGTLLEFGFADLRTFARQIPQGHSMYLFTPSGRLGNFYVDSTQTSDRKQFLSNLFLPPVQRAGSHQLKAGIDFDRLNYSQNTRRTGFGNIGLSGDLLRRVMFQGSGLLTRPSLEFSSYVLDNWKVRPNFFVQAGVRQDWNELVRQAILSPRISFSYAPFQRGNTKIAAGYSITYDAATPQLFSRPFDEYSLTTLYDRGGTIQTGPAATVFTIGPHLKMPRYRNWSLGLEQLLPARVFLSLNLLRRRGSDGFTYINALNPDLPPPPDLVALYHTTRFQSIFRLDNSRREAYDSAEIRLRQPFGKSYEWMASYTRSRAFSNAVLDVTVDQPSLISDNTGRLPWDSPNRLLSWGYLPTPWKDWAIAYLVEARSGFPFSIVDEIGRVLGAPNSDRFPDYFNFNLHAERTLRFSGYRFAVRGGFNNITNHRNFTVVNSTLGSPSFLSFFGSDGRHFVVRLRWLGREKS
jgi:carboxypeptidase family protein